MALMTPTKKIPVRDLVLAVTVGFLVLFQGVPMLRALGTQQPGNLPAAALGAAFTHQGRLTADGVPANGPFDMQFALFDSESGGNTIEVLPLLSGVNVVNGLYSVQLSFAESAFRGQERWLEVNARPSGPGNFTLLGRQQLTATPYALYAKAADWSGITNVPQALSIGSANCTEGQIWKRVGGNWQCAADDTGLAGTGNNHNHLGQTWSGSFPVGLSITSLTGKGLFAAGPGGGIEGTTATDGSAGVSGTNTGTCLGALTCYGVRGTANNVSGVGVRGEGYSVGVVGESFNTGVFGKSGFNVGVQGESSSSFGVWGKSTSGSGVYGTTVSGSTSLAGVQGSAVNGVGVLGTGTYGVWGKGTSGTGVIGQSTSSAGVTGSSTSGSGVYGESTSDSGVYGYSASSSSSDAGVWGESPNGTGVLGKGTTGVSGQGNITGVNATGVFFGVSASATTTTLSGNGVHATGRGPDDAGAGVYGQNYTNQGCQPLGAASPETYCYGVYGHAEGSAGIGVMGQGANTGVWADGGPYGIYAQGDLYAGYFQGNLHYTGAITNSSDLRLKRDVAPLEYGLSAVEALQPKSYLFIQGDGATRFGLLAQDVEQVLPELVSTDPLTGMLSMNYIDLIPVLIKSIQEQQAEIDALQSMDKTVELRQAPAAAATATASSTEPFAIGIAIASMLTAFASLSGTVIVARRRR